MQNPFQEDPSNSDNDEHGNPFSAPREISNAADKWTGEEAGIPIDRADSTSSLRERLQMTPQKRSRKGWQKARNLLNPGRRQSYVAELDEEEEEEPAVEINAENGDTTEDILLGFDNNVFAPQNNSPFAIVSESTDQLSVEHFDEGDVSEKVDMERIESPVQDAESSTKESLMSTEEKAEDVENVPNTAPIEEPTPSAVPVTLQESAVLPHDCKAEDPTQSVMLESDSSLDSDSDDKDEYEDDPSFKKISTAVREALANDINCGTVTSSFNLTFTKPENVIFTSETSETVPRSARYVPTLPPRLPRGNRRYVTEREIVQWENHTQTGLANWEKELSQEIDLQRDLTMLDVELELATRQKDALEKAIDEARLYKETTSDPKILELIQENQRLTEKLLELGIQGVSLSLLGVAHELYNHVNMPASGQQTGASSRDALHASLLNFLSRSNQSVVGSDKAISSGAINMGKKTGGGEQRRHRVHDVGIDEENAKARSSTSSSCTQVM